MFKVFRILFWVLLALSVILAIAMTIPEFAVILRILQLSSGTYLGYLAATAIISFIISYGFTNLWWVLLLLTPFVWFSRSRPIFGLTVSCVAYLLIWFVPPKIIETQTNAILANAHSISNGGAVHEKIESITLDTYGCDLLCEEILLSGEVSTVRTRQSKTDNVPRLQYFRATSNECKSLDPRFPKGAFCILSKLDGNMESDVAINYVSSGNQTVKRKDIGFSPRILKTEIIEIVHQNTGQVLVSDSSISWLEPQGYVPLYANTGFDGRGVHGGGIYPAQKKRNNDVLERRKLLQDIGIKLGATRSFKVVNAKARDREKKGYLEHADYELALISSIIRHEGSLSSTNNKMINDWLARFSHHNFVPDEREKEIFEKLRKRQRAFSDTLYRLQTRSPDYFSGGIRSFYLEIESDIRSVNQRGKNVVSYNVLREAPEVNSMNSDIFLDYIQRNVATERLINLAGRYEFNPVEILQAFYENPKNKREKSRKARSVLRSACSADPRWTKSLKPFVRKIVNEHLDNRRVVAVALRFFNVNGLKTEIDTLRSRIDSEMNSKIRLPKLGKGKMQC